MIKIKGNGTKLMDVSYFTFPSGCEPHVKIIPYEFEYYTIDCRITKTEDIIYLLLVTDAIKRMGGKDIRLFIPFLPFARQDRVMVPGEPLSIKVLSDLINSQGFSEVTLFDPHSEVAPALINNCKVIENHEFVKSACSSWIDNCVIVCPDAGAYKKIFKLCQFLNFKGDIALCNKIRNVSTGQIIANSCDMKDFDGRTAVIIDDICDGGYTFVLLAQELMTRNVSSIELIVSHGIFSKGIDALSYIDFVHCTDSYLNGITHEKLTTYGLLP